MWILPLVGYIGLLLGFLFLTLSIASGLYYLSELVEEHTVLSAKLLKRLIYAVITFLGLLWLIDSFPLHLVVLSMASHAIYLGNLRHFPLVKLTDPIFLASCVLVLLNHWLWFRFFSSPDAFRRVPSNKTPAASSLYGTGGGYSYYDQPTFTEIASYFGLCVWLVPFALFVSLSAGDNVLPTTGLTPATTPSIRTTEAMEPFPSMPGLNTNVSSMSGGSGGGSYKKGHRRRNTGLAKAAVANAREWVGETGAIMGLWKKDNVRSFD